VLVASTALGRPLPSGVEVHHVDGDKWNNRGSNLVVCQDKAYHRLLERRTRALQACGNANWRRCRFCGEWAPVEDLYVSPNGRCVHHRQCDAAYARDRKLVSA